MTGFLLFCFVFERAFEALCQIGLMAQLWYVS